MATAADHENVIDHLRNEIERFGKEAFKQPWWSDEILTKDDGLLLLFLLMETEGWFWHPTPLVLSDGSRAWLEVGICGFSGCLSKTFMGEPAKQCIDEFAHEQLMILRRIPPSQKPS